MSSVFSQYNGMVLEGARDFPREPQIDIQFVWGEGDTSLFIEDIRKFWDDPEDFSDLGGHETILPYSRVYMKGEEHLKTILRAIDKKKKRKGSTLAAFDILWNALKVRVSEDSTFFA